MLEPVISAVSHRNAPETYTASTSSSSLACSGFFVSVPAALSSSRLSPSRPWIWLLIPSAGILDDRNIIVRYQADSCSGGGSCSFMHSRPTISLINMKPLRRSQSRSDHPRTTGPSRRARRPRTLSPFVCNSPNRPTRWRHPLPFSRGMARKSTKWEKRAAGGFRPAGECWRNGWRRQKRMIRGSENTRRRSRRPFGK